MNSYSGIDGIEFDWFATDQSGNVALFATAGAGFVPASVFANREHYEEVSEAIEVRHWGSNQIWDNYAMLGLYVYDWRSPGGLYIQLRKPGRELDAELKTRIGNLPLLPQLNINFDNVMELSARELQDRSTVVVHLG